MDGVEVAKDVTPVEESNSDKSRMTAFSEFFAKLCGIPTPRRFSPEIFWDRRFGVSSDVMNSATLLSA